jgi:hypothetical protein
VQGHAFSKSLGEGCRLEEGEGEEEEERGEERKSPENRGKGGRGLGKSTMHAGFQSMGPRYHATLQEESLAPDPAAVAKQLRRRSMGQASLRANPHSPLPVGASQSRSLHAPSPRHQHLRAHLKSGAPGAVSSSSPLPSDVQSSILPRRSSSDSRRGSTTGSNFDRRPSSTSSKLTLHHLASAKRLASKSSPRNADAGKAKRLASAESNSEKRTASTSSKLTLHHLASAKRLASKSSPRNADAGKAKRSASLSSSPEASDRAASSRKSPEPERSPEPSNADNMERGEALQGNKGGAAKRIGGAPPSASGKGPSMSFLNRQGTSRRRSSVGIELGLPAVDGPVIVELTPEEKRRREEEEAREREEKERERRLAQVDKDLKEIMSRHKEDLVAREERLAAQEGEQGSTLGGLASMFGDSFAELTAATDSMPPVQQRELLLRQTSAQMAAVHHALSSLEEEKGRTEDNASKAAPLGPSSPSPPANAPPLRHPPHHHEYPPPGQADDAKATLNSQAMMRLDLKAITEHPGTRGLIPSLPLTVVRRANFRINRIYRAHVQGTERIHEILSNICPEARTLLLEREIEPTRPQSAVSVQDVLAENGGWRAAEPSCAPDPPWLDGSGWGVTGTAGIPIVPGREGARGVSWIKTGDAGGTNVSREHIKGVKVQTNPKVQANGSNKGESRPATKPFYSHLIEPACRENKMCADRHACILIPLTVQTSRL